MMENEGPSITSSAETLLREMRTPLTLSRRNAHV